MFSIKGCSQVPAALSLPFAQTERSLLFRNAYLGVQSRMIVMNKPKHERLQLSENVERLLSLFKNAFIPDLYPRIVKGTFKIYSKSQTN